ncbi:hypothetical protein E2C01_074029 [Portunus trituberculatus]|uniref:Secreted protein n=1 Tax=Portunus trituberculatus TaxID=210409 RepID=A0A5B7I4H9_PORTR|nr:hypothetical protein [Portunus trituberculatus]
MVSFALLMVLWHFSLMEAVLIGYAQTTRYAFLPSSRPSSASLPSSLCLKSFLPSSITHSHTSQSRVFCLLGGQPIVVQRPLLMAPALLDLDCGGGGRGVCGIEWVRNCRIIAVREYETVIRTV